MKDKTKKLLKKGLRLGGAIGLTTLLLGGSFLLGFESGRATFQKKEEKTSLSAAKPKEALQPKHAPNDHVDLEPTEYMQELVGRNDLYLKGKADLPSNFAQADKLAFTIFGDITIRPMARDGSWTNQTALLDFYYSYENGKPTYTLTTMGGDNYTPADGELRITFSKIGAWQWTVLNTAESLMNVDRALNWSMAKVKDNEYFSPNQTSDWLSVFTGQGNGACLVPNNATYDGYPIGKYGIEISGEFLWVDRILPDFKDVMGNTSIQTDQYGTPVRTATDDQYDYLAGVRIYIEGFTDARNLAVNTWAFNGSSIYNGKMPDYWGYPGLTDGSNVKIYHWGTMRTRATKYPNGEGGYRDYFEYTRIIGGSTMKDFKPIIVGGKDDGNVGDVFTLIGSAFAGLAPFLAIQIIPSLTIGTLLLVPFIVTMVIVIIKMLRK